MPFNNLNFNTLNYTALKETASYYTKEHICDMANMDVPTDDEPMNFVARAVSLSTRVTEEKKDEYYKAFRKLCEFLYSIHCPEEGSFIGWKIGTTAGSPNNLDEQLLGLCLIELEIPEDAKRSSCYGKKCRCDKALVKSITKLEARINDRSLKIIELTDSHVYAAYSAIHSADRVTYTVGQMVEADSFDENRWRECSHGIHFFVHRSDALQYAWDYFSPQFYYGGINP